MYGQSGSTNCVNKYQELSKEIDGNCWPCLAILISDLNYFCLLINHWNLLLKCLSLNKLGYTCGLIFPHF